MGLFLPHNVSKLKSKDVSKNEVDKTLRQENDKSNSVKKKKSFTHILTYLPANFKMRRIKCAFTLAEVLITLGIVGIVAALTLPALTAKYTTHEKSAKLKKFYSNISQAILLSENENGPSGDWGRTNNIKDEDGNRDIQANAAEIKRYFNKYLAPYLKYDKNIQTEGERICINLLDGSNVTLGNFGCFVFTYDVNGEKQPDKSGVDKFVFELCPSDMQQYYLGQKGRSFAPSGLGQSGNRAEALENCRQIPDYCASLLMIDNWEFKDDYPWK